MAKRCDNCDKWEREDVYRGRCKITKTEKFCWDKCLKFKDEQGIEGNV